MNWLNASSELTNGILADVRAEACINPFVGIALVVAWLIIGYSVLVTITSRYEW